MDIREKIAETLEDEFSKSATITGLHLHSHAIADAILQIPEIKEALEDKRRHNLLCEMVRLDQEMGLYDTDDKVPPAPNA